jgi:DNA-binding MarR family transcriptional regulator
MQFDLIYLAAKKKAYKVLEKRYKLTACELDYLILLDALSKEGIVNIKLIDMRNSGIYSHIAMFKANEVLEYYKYVERRKRIKTEPYYVHITEAGKAVIKDIERTIKRESKKQLNVV